MAVVLTGSAQPVQPQLQPPAANLPGKAAEKAPQERPPVLITLSELEAERQDDHRSDDDGRTGPSPWYDLVAQSLMALWAFLQLALTAVGIWYIRKTLIETEKAVHEANRATDVAMDAVEVTRQSAERQLRPWMLFQSIEAQPSEDGSFTILVVWMNFGQSLAVDVEVLTRWCTYLPTGEAPVRDITEAEGTPVIVGVVAPATRAPNIIEPLSSEQFWNQRLSLTSRCRYRDAATGTSHESLVTLTCGVIRGPNSAYAVRWTRLAPDTAT